ncbi:MAG: DegV family protein [Streptococcus sp.]
MISGFTDQAMKFQVVEAAKLAKDGADLDTVLARIEEVKEKDRVVYRRIYLGKSG